MASSASFVRKRLARLGRRLGGGLLDVLYPPRCLSCNARTPPEGDPLCAACLAGLERVRPEAVRRRLAEWPEAEDVFDGALALWRFDPDGALRAFQHALKYRNRPRYGVAAGQWLGQALGDTLPHGGASVAAVAPVPLHRARRLERGYNQSTMLARGVARRLDTPCRPDLLVRTRATRSQTHLARRARWKNVAGAFDAAHAPPTDGPLLLVDDVLTTGATATAAAQALRRAGAARVQLATLALAG